MVLVSNRDVCVRAHEEVAVCTGVAFHMPYMLVGMITDAGNIMHVDVRTDMYDYDDARDFLNVRLIYRPPPSLAESKPMLHISRGDPLAYLTILPIGRPGLRTVRLAGPENEEEEEGEEEEGDEAARLARMRQDEARQMHKILTEQALEQGVRCGGARRRQRSPDQFGVCQGDSFYKKKHHTCDPTHHTPRLAASGGAALCDSARQRPAAPIAPARPWRPTLWARRASASCTTRSRTFWPCSSARAPTSSSSRPSSSASSATRRRRSTRGDRFATRAAGACAAACCASRAPPSRRCCTRPRRSSTRCSARPTRRTPSTRIANGSSTRCAG